MNARIRALLALVLLLGAGAADASRPLGGSVTGSVTAVSGTSITVNGVTYGVLANSPAVAEVSQVQPGQRVTLQLNGPAGAASAQVVTIQPAPPKP